MGEISDDDIVTPKEALEVLFDNRNYAAETFLDKILALNNKTLSENAKIGFNILNTWDRKNDPDSKGALLFHQFWKRIIKMGIISNPDSDNPELGSQLDITPKNYPDIVNALDESVQELAGFGFDPDVPWGEILYQTANGTHVPLHGGSYQEGILNGEMPAALTSEGFPYILFGTAYVQLIDWENDTINAHVVLSHGQRDGMETVGRNAQLKMFSNKELYRVPFTKKDLDRAEVIDSLRLTIDYSKSVF